MGGLSRRSTIIEQKKKEDSSLLIVDSGNFSSPRTELKADELAQFRLKSQLMMETFVLDGVQALGLGEKDFSLGAEWLLAETTKHNLPIVLSNLNCVGVDIPKVQTVVANGVQFNFYSLLSEKAKIKGCVVTSPTEAWNKLKAESKGGITVLFSHLGKTELTGDLLDFDIVMETAMGKRIDSPEALDGDTVMLGAGSKGKVLGFAELQLHPDHKGFRAVNAMGNLDTEIDRWERKLEKLQKDVADEPDDKVRIERQVKYYSEKKDVLEQKRSLLSVAGKSHEILNSLIPLGAAVDDHPAVAAKLVKALEAIEAETKEQTAKVYSGDYVGSLRCFSCHQEQRKQWQETKHSHAWNSLEKEKRMLDMECFACHSTGSLQEGGATHPNQVLENDLQNVGCESCHGAGKEHVKAPSGANISKTVGVEVCTTCHDGIQDNGQFDHEKYRVRIMHERSGN